VRHTPLTHRTPLARSAALAPKHTREPVKPRRRPSSGVPVKVRDALRERSGGVCELTAPGCTGQATDFAHRKKVAAGGRKGAAARADHVLSNALAACRSCHQNCHEAPPAAYWRGWMLHENEDPTVVPVLYRGCWSLLSNDGTVLPSTKTTADIAEEA
jgi:cytochrome c553